MTTHPACNEYCHRFVGGPGLLLYVVCLHRFALATLEHAVVVFFWLLLLDLDLGFAVPEIPYFLGVKGIGLEFTGLDSIQEARLVVVANRVYQRTHSARVE